MINLKGKDAVADAVKSVLSQEATDVDARTKDDIGGRKKTTQKDDVGPAADGKSTKVKLQGESTEKTLANTKPPSSVKTDEPEPREKVDTQATKQNKSLRGFKEKYEGHSIYDQMINEVLSKDASAGTWIKDFVNSDNPKFAGKSKEQRKKQALAAYYSKKNEEVEQIEELSKETLGSYVDAAKEDNKAHADSRRSGDREESRYAKDRYIKRNTGIGAAQNRLKKEEVEQIEEGDRHTLAKKLTNRFYRIDKKLGKLAKATGKTGINTGLKDEKSTVQKGVKQSSDADVRRALNKEETVEEGWDDMLADVKKRNAPQPNGGSGKKQGTAYGGSKQKDEPEKKEVKEGKEEQPAFDPPYKKKPADVKDKSGATHTPMSRAKDLARSAMSRLKKDLGKKAK